MSRRSLIALLIAGPLLCGACSRSSPPAANVAVTQGSRATQAAADIAIETEIVTTAPISGAVTATGKVAAPEDRVAVIGPVNEGRIVRLYAGQGSRVRKGQKLADLESADIDQAEADYLKALADAENAKRSAAAEIKLAQQTYDRTKSLYEKTVVPGKNVQSAEHDLEIAKATAANNAASTKAVLTAARFERCNDRRAGRQAGFGRDLCA